MAKVSPSWAKSSTSASRPASSRKSGAWFSYDSQRLDQGRENSKPFLKANPDVTAKIEAAIRQTSALIAEQILAGSPERDAEGEEEPAED